MTYRVAPNQRSSPPGQPGPSSRYKTTRPIAGVSLLVFSTWALSCLDGSGKWSMEAGAPLLLLCWMRYVVHLGLAVALILPARGARGLRSLRVRDQILRGIFMLASTLASFTTLHFLPQAEATAIYFLAPLIVLAFAPWVLQEPMRISRWVAAGVGFMGVLIVIRPGSGLDATGTIFGLITAILIAGQSIATRRVAVDNPYTTLVWSGLVGSVCLTFTMPFWLSSVLSAVHTLGPFQWMILISTGAWGALGHLLQIKAYQNAPASLLAPFTYLQIIAAAALGWFIWSQFPDAISWLGIIIICASGLSIGVVEWRKGRKSIPA